ncbi:MAG: RNA-binding S4 domain-containing protein [Clostridia bacterium]|nr:RNA-binding S4 domain-containing protein [Clostridia bacterium]
MRIDKFLKVSRILKRRTLAQEACDKGKVTVNGKTVKSGHKVKAGDIVEITYTESSVKFKITEIRETVKKDDASSLYEII